MEVLVLEHWHAGYRSLAGMASLFGDGQLIYGPIYSFFRLVKLEPYLSAECATIVVRTAGFCGFYVAARQLLDLKPGWATLATVAFTLGSGALTQASHAQLVSLAFAPVVAVLLHGTAEALRTMRRAQAIARGVPAACLTAVWLLTAAHIACVFLLLLLLAALAYLALIRRTGLRAALEAARRRDPTRASRYPIS